MSVARRKRNWTIALACFLVVALLSVLQIFLRQSSMGIKPNLTRLVWTNLLAWAPWPLLAPSIVRRWVNDPPWDVHPWRSLLRHCVAATVVAVAYLTYLTFFRFVFFSYVTGPMSMGSLVKRLAVETGDFFVITWAIYWFIGICGFVLNKDQLRPTPTDLAPPNPAAESPTDRIEIRSMGNSLWVLVAEVIWIEADGSYVLLHGAEKTHTHRETMGRLASMLKPHGFVRIHRSVIVNIDYIKQVKAASHGDASVVLLGGRTLRVSRTYRSQLEITMAHRTVMPTSPGSG